MHIETSIIGNISVVKHHNSTIDKLKLHYRKRIQNTNPFLYLFCSSLYSEFWKKFQERLYFARIVIQTFGKTLFDIAAENC